MSDLLMEEQAIRMRDGAQSRITVFHDGVGASPVIVCMPAMGTPAKYYEPLAMNLFEKGFNVITADLRGNGKSSVRASRSTDFGFHEMISHDWPVIVEMARERFPNRPVFLLGHSLGGQLSSLYAGKNAGQIDGLILVAACAVYYKGWSFPRNIGVLLGTRFARLLSAIWGHLPGKQIGFGGREARTVIRDWAHNALTGRYELANSSHDFEASLKEVDIPILMISMKGDQLSPRKAVKFLGDKMSRADILYVHMTHGEMEKKGLNHFKWVRHSQPIAATIKEWTEEKWRSADVRHIV